MASIPGVQQVETKAGTFPVLALVGVEVIPNMVYMMMIFHCFWNPPFDPLALWQPGLFRACVIYGILDPENRSHFSVSGYEFK